MKKNIYRIEKEGRISCNREKVNIVKERKNVGVCISEVTMVM